MFTASRCSRRPDLNVHPNAIHAAGDITSAITQSVRIASGVRNLRFCFRETIRAAAFAGRAAFAWKRLFL